MARGLAYLHEDIPKMKGEGPKPAIAHRCVSVVIYGAFPLQGLARLSTVRLGLVRTGSLYGTFPLQFSSWGSIHSNAV